MAAIQYYLRFGLRAIRRQPVQALLTALVLTIGFGPSFALMQVSAAALSQPLPYASAERLVVLNSVRGDGRSLSVTYGALAKLEAEHVPFSAVSALQRGSSRRTLDFDYDSGEYTDRLDGARVSPSFFDVLQPTPAAGRLFTALSVRAGERDVVVLSHEFWQRALGAAGEAIGKPMRLGDRVYTVIGVTPRDMPTILGQVHDVYIPWTVGPGDSRASSEVCCQVLARLQPGASVESANAYLATRASGLRRLVAVPLARHLLGNVPDILRLLGLAVALLLALSAVTAAYFQLAQSLGSRRDMAIMSALGASAMDLAASQAAPTFLLGTISVALSLLLCQPLVRLAEGLAPDGVSLAPGGPGLWSIVYAVAAPGAITALAMAIGLVRHSTRNLPQLRADSIAGSGVATASPSRWRRRICWVVATALTLLIGLSGMTGAELFRLNEQSLGFSAHRLAAAEVRLWGPRFGDLRAVQQFETQVLEDLRVRFGVTNATWSSSVPLVALGQTRVETVGDRRVEFNQRQVHWKYFDVLGIPILEGRGFVEHEPEPAAIISKAAARTLFHNHSPIGRRLPLETSAIVVGVSGDVISTVGGPALPAVYVTRTQMPTKVAWLLWRDSSGVLSERTVRQLVERVSPGQPVDRFVWLEDVVTEIQRPRKFVTMTVLALACIGWIVSFTALHGSMLHSLTERRSEIGVRLALGGTPRTVAAFVAWQELSPLLAGAVCGALLILPSSDLVRHALVGQWPIQMGVVVATAMVFLGSGVWWLTVPVRRLTQTEPRRLL